MSQKLPLGQALQSLAPDRCWYVPGLHERQTLEPSGAKVPGAHAVHLGACRQSVAVGAVHAGLASLGLVVAGVARLAHGVAGVAVEGAEGRRCRSTRRPWGSRCPRGSPGTGPRGVGLYVPAGHLLQEELMVVSVEEPARMGNQAGKLPAVQAAQRRQSWEEQLTSGAVLAGGCALGVGVGANVAVSAGDVGGAGVGVAGSALLHPVAPEARKVSEPRGQENQVLAAMLDLR